MKRTLLALICLLFFEPLSKGETKFSYILLNLPGTTFNQASGINSSGEIVGSYEDSDFFSHGFLLKNGTTCDRSSANCITIDVPGSFGTILTGINDSEEIVGFYEAFGTPSPRAFIYSHGTFTGIDCPGALDTVATGINNAGDVVGHCSFEVAPFTLGVLGFIRRQNNLIMINTCQALPFQPRTFVTGINNNGQIVGYCTGGDDTPTGFILTGGIPVFVGVTPAGINTAGEILESGGITGTVLLSGTSCSASAQNCATIACPDASFTSAFGIDDAGQVVGTCFISSGSNQGRHGFVATPGCQVSVQRTGQCQISNPPVHWGQEQYAFHTGTIMCGKGCVTTALSMDLISQGVFRVPLCTGFLNCFGLPLVTNDPGTLNSFMTRLGPLSLGDYDTNNNVNPAVTTIDLARQLGFLPLTFRGFNRGLISFANLPPAPNDPARDALDNALCGGHPVIVRVTGSDGIFGDHSVLVTGKQGDDYMINDPAGAAPGSTGIPKLCPNDATQSKPCSLLSQYGEFEVMGYVSDPPSDRSNLNIVVDTNADLMLTDSLGRRTGFDPATGHDVTEIPDAVHFVNATDDEETGALPTSAIHWVNSFQPGAGSYQVTVTGINLGSYTVAINVASADGTPEAPLSLPGVGTAGSRSTFNIEFSPVPGTGATLSRLATFQGTLTDINNCMQLGLFTNAGIANSLSQKIMAAQDSSGLARNNILNAFQAEIRAQSGKHITGIASQILIEDAASLIAQNTQ